MTENEHYTDDCIDLADLVVDTELLLYFKRTDTLGWCNGAEWNSIVSITSLPNINLTPMNK